MEKKVLDKILKDHSLWLSDTKIGNMADLSWVNLSWVNLSGANLSGANLSEVNLSEANLSGANLYRANLSGANLSWANLYKANLSGANLSGANLSWTNLYRANLSGANLSGANLSRTNLYRANLSEANLSGANLSEANLSWTNLYRAILPNFQICPENGAFMAYKKTTKGIIKIEIPAKALRTSTLIGRECRASFIKVISGKGCGGSSPLQGNLTYEKGTLVFADSFDPNPAIECTNGIHFFMTEKEALEF